ncbi:uncharacterized protein [Typha latifolia]|uniref:uncharacterized protein n=1 Tax=Typha latifolia TaxID=4733 RepID=UPI003C2D516E
MGNTGSSSTGSIKVITNDGIEEDYGADPVRAAELMVGNPGQFVCDANHLNVGCRVPGLTADEELQRHHLYFLLPMDMLYSVLTDEEMAILSHRASGAVKRRRRAPAKSLVRILPMLGEFCLLPTSEATCDEEPMINAVTMKQTERPTWQRSWRPALDTIEEVP